ncbi:MAG: alkaline phosphatase [Flavobacteriales bacterium]|nr:alkaline phosphatase [Flavobacteriales bacterium]
MAILAQQPKNVILMIGDGMGLTQMSTIFYFGNTEENFSRFYTIGLMNTSPEQSLITDSAAGATAFATGLKTYNGAISVDTNKVAIQNVAERLNDDEISIGLVATSGITHATPACFYAHAEHRNQKDTIAYQLSQSNIDFFAGGGLQYFYPQNRKDGIDVLKLLKDNGFSIDTTALNKDLLSEDKVGYFLAQGGLPSKLEGRDNYLKEATEMAIEFLSKKEGGFFLMVEGSQIDWEGHAANAHGIIEEVKDFDQAIGAALDFAEKDGETLVIVTADHETGGFALAPDIQDNHWKYDTIVGQFYEGAKSLSYAAHTTTLIPVYAYGPSSASFGGFYQNNDIFHKIMEAAKW